MKKAISILLSLVIAASVFPVNASAARKYTTEPKVEYLNTVLNCDTGLGIGVSGLNGDNIQDAGYDGYYVSIYDKSIKKYKKLFTMNTVTSCGYYYVKNLEPETEYKFAVRFFKNENGKQKTVKSYYSTQKTRAALPHATVWTDNKNIKLKWTMYGEWDGYEITTWKYGEKDSESDAYRPLKEHKVYTIKGGNKTACTIKSAFEDDLADVSIKAYKTKNGKKIYSDPKYVNMYEMQFNSAAGNNKVSYTSSEKDNKIIKKVLKAAVTDDMSPYQKGFSLIRYVRANGKYEYDYSKIDSSPIQAVFVKQKAQCYQWAEAYRILLECVGVKGFKTVSGYKGNSYHWWVETDLSKYGGGLSLADPYPFVSMRTGGIHYMCSYEYSVYNYGSKYVKNT